MNHPVPEVASSAVTQRLDALLELTRVSRERPNEVLPTVVEVVKRVVGFTTVVVNIYRPAWDDYQVVLVAGPEAAREALLGTVNSRESWEEEVLRAAHEKVPGAFFLDAEVPDVWARIDQCYTPDELESWSGPDRWRAEDGLFVPLRASNGTMLGVLSLDAPSSGRRPSDSDLEVLVAVTNHASLALDNARYVADAERYRRTLADLLEVSSRLASHTTVTGVLDQFCTSAVPALGFEHATVYLRVGRELELAALRGDVDGDDAVSYDAVVAVLDEGAEHGCALVKRADVVPHGRSSRRNGRGPLAWDDHRLIVPLRPPGGELTGVVVFDDPVDRLLPDPTRCQALRLLADNAVAVLESIKRQSHVEYLASHDPLTGVRNRRDLHRAIDALAAGPEGVSVLMCDLDQFKQVNDRFGHDVGDQALERFGAVLRDQARADDVPVRTGGEEFCLVLPRIDAVGAMATAERLRQATATAMADIAPGLTVSIGTATAGPRTNGTAARLLAAADSALYAAKAAGRNQCCSASQAVTRMTTGPGPSGAIAR